MELPSLSKKEAVIMQLLACKREMYGLEMINESPKLKRGTIYVTLQRMGEKGYVASRLEPEGSGGPARRVYSLTGLGHRVHAAWQSAHSAFADFPLEPAVPFSSLFAIPRPGATHV